MRAISLERSNIIINALLAAAKERGLKPLTVIVLDAGGRVKAFQKQDGAALLRFEISHGKAFAALGMGRASKLVLQKFRDKPKFIDNLEQLSDGPIFLEGGSAADPPRTRRSGRRGRHHRRFKRNGRRSRHGRHPRRRISRGSEPV